MNTRADEEAEMEVEVDSLGRGPNQLKGTYDELFSFFSPPLSSDRLSASREFPSSRRSTSTGSTLSFLHGGHVLQLGARRIHRGHLGPHQRLRPREPRGDFEARKGTLIFCIL